jgi:predicted RNA binding protein YcfA (HicA-like mRNA interferase family)
MRIPRALSGDQLAKALGQLGYRVTRQTGSHLRLTTQVGGEHHITIPRHGDLRVGTLGAVLNEVSRHMGISRQELAQSLFDRRT